MNFKDRLLGLVLRFADLTERSFDLKRRVFAVMATVAFYFVLLGILFADGCTATVLPYNFRFDYFCFVCSMIVIYLSGCTIFAGPVCLCLCACLSFVLGFECVSFFDAASSLGAINYFAAAFCAAYAVFAFFVAAALAVCFSAYSSHGVKQMLDRGRFSLYSLKFIMLIASCILAFGGLYNLLF